MCGICGLYNYQTGEPCDELLVKQMADAIIHRGPDDEGYYTEGCLGLGMRRLSIIDLEGGHQPMCNEDGTVWIVFNGEIYNFVELRQDLQAHGHCFRTRSDTEVIVHAYEEWGLNGLAKLNGMFGMAIWDGPRQELILARDRFGIKPLYYADTGGRLLFGSEVKAILFHGAVIRAVDRASLDQFLTFTFVPSPRTLFSNIQKLPPGYALRIKREGMKLERLPLMVPPRLFKSQTDWLEALRYEVEGAVHRQMVADVPVGVMLSGGVDSATVASLMRRFSGGPVHSFTVGFSGQFAQNELKDARRTAQLLGTEHHEAVISAADYADFLPRSLWYLEEPVATGSTLAFYWICLLARQTVKVVLTGQGADEAFAGYPRHLGEYYGGWYRHLPAFAREQVVGRLVHRLPRNERLRRAVQSLDIRDPLSRLAQVYTIFDSDLKTRLYRPGLMDGQTSSPKDAIRAWQQDVEHLDGLSQMLYVDARFSLPDNLLMYGDKMSMAASLEARVPFLDSELMSLVENMPPALKIHGFTQKYLLKLAVSPWVPCDVINRRKIGFSTPLDQWFGRELKSYIGDQLLASTSACAYYFQARTIKEMIFDHATRRRDYKRHLFSLLTFELWHQQLISQRIHPCGA